MSDPTPAEPPVPCIVYRCARQDEMYVYVRADLKAEELPETLRRATGRLTQAMTLALHSGRRLARADVAQVMRQLREQGYYLQLPPEGRMTGHLYEGD